MRTQKKSLPGGGRRLLFVIIIHAGLSSNWLAGNNDNDDHDERNGPVELSYDVIDCVIVFVYPHGGADDFLLSTQMYKG
ncbi:hypothetical protein [Chitinophaga deserti]|uniref:hypothetical protein n=1 Tax=Chitinophaga deserti TaxID=2164099 RepID=UPI0011595CC9|nr:hypothetical protein [Chitinophaga deserti]